MRRLYDCELADILYIPPIRMGGGKSIYHFGIYHFVIYSGAKLQLFFDICKFLRVFLTKSDVFSEIWLFCAAFSLNLFCFSPFNKVLLRRFALSIILRKSCLCQKNIVFF